MMKTIDNYIQEKLYISKDFKTVNTYKDMIDYMKKSGYRLELIDQSSKDIYKMYKDDNEYPFITLYSFTNNDSLFLISGQLYTNLEQVKVVVQEIKNSSGLVTSRSSIEYNPKKEGLEMTKVGRSKAYKVTLDNADIVMRILDKTKRN